MNCFLRALAISTGFLFLSGCATRGTSADLNLRAPASAEESQGDAGLAAGQNPENAESLETLRNSSDYNSCIAKGGSENVCINLAMPLPLTIPASTETVRCRLTTKGFVADASKLSDLREICGKLGGVGSRQSITSSCQLTWTGYIASIHRFCLKAGIRND